MFETLKAGCLDDFPTLFCWIQIIEKYRRLTRAPHEPCRRCLRPQPGSRSAAKGEWCRSGAFHVFLGHGGYVDIGPATWNKMNQKRPGDLGRQCHGRSVSNVSDCLGHGEWGLKASPGSSFFNGDVFETLKIRLGFASAEFHMYLVL